jgi:hypothetical protein
MSELQAGEYLEARGIVAGPEDCRSTLEIAQAFGYVALEATEVEINQT